MKFLGLIIDSRLGWNAHVEYVAKKMARGLLVLRGIRIKLMLLSSFKFIIPIYKVYCPLEPSFGVTVIALKTVFSTKKSNFLLSAIRS